MSLEGGGRRRGGEGRGGEDRGGEGGEGRGGREEEREGGSGGMTVIHILMASQYYITITSRIT